MARAAPPVGLTLLFPSGDFADSLDRAAQACDSAAASGCENIEGVKPGVNYGIGLGVLTGGSVRFRGDLMFQGYIINVYSLEFDTPDATISNNLYGNRFFLLAGIEI